jgi:hypothetical protein
MHDLAISGQWRNYYGLGPGEPGGPQSQWAKWRPPNSGCRAKTLARASDMSTMSFSDHRNSVKWLTPKSGKWHFRESRFKKFPCEPWIPRKLVHIRCSTRAFGTSTRGGLRTFWTGGPLYNVTPLFLGSQILKFSWGECPGPPNDSVRRWNHVGHQVKFGPGYPNLPGQPCVLCSVFWISIVACFVHSYTL